MMWSSWTAVASSHRFGTDTVVVRGNASVWVAAGPGSGVHSNFVVHAIVLITAEPARIAALASDIADLDGVSATYSVAGDEDIVVIIRVSDHESLADLVTGSIAAQPGVLRTRTLIAFRVYSQADLESI